MALASHVFIVVCALVIWSAGPAEATQSNPLTVHINLVFDGAMKSDITKSFAMREATTIWAIYGVELQWSDRDCGAALDLDVRVDGQEPGTVLDGSASVLGTTTVDRAGVVQAPIHISLDTIEWLLRHRTDRDPVLYDRELGRALGRVMAHEIGHVLLGMPTYHDNQGLMRARLPIHELARFDRGGFHLTEASARRLRARIAQTADAQGSGVNSSR